MNKIRSYSFCLFTLASTLCFSQTLSTKNKKAIDLYNEADNYRVRGQLNQAIKLLKQAIDKDGKFEEAYFRLGIVYRGAGDRAASSNSFEKGLALVSNYVVKQKVYYAALGDDYLRRGLYEKAKFNFEKFLAIEKTDKSKIDLVALLKSQSEYGLTHQNENLGYTIKPLSDTINKYQMQYFPTITADGQELFFTRRLGINDNDDEDIVVSLNKNGVWGDPSTISENINSRSDEGTCTISADGRYMIFVARDAYGHTDLFESRRKGNEWTAPVNLGILVNSTVWDSQPSLSADGRELYFVSARKGGVGGRDIWYSKKDSLGKWIRAVNVGKPINTKYDEEAPYIHVNNRNLFFASNGLPGFGGYDIYVSEKDQQWQEPKNLGAPLNDFEDQYSFTVTSDGMKAFYTREQPGMKSKIYETTIPKELQIQSRGNIVKGTVTDSQTKKPIPSDVELFDLKANKRISMFTSDSVNGHYLIVVPGKSEYALHVSEPGYLFYSLHFNDEEKDQDQPLTIDIALQPIKKNAVTVLNNIFFEFNKYEINPKSFTELDEVVKFLKDNPTIKVEISGHTDNVGNESYNQQLSLKRAQSVVEFLSSKGIAPTRLAQVGYGSKKPIKPNDSEENRQVNRRIEFKIQ